MYADAQELNVSYNDLKLLPDRLGDLCNLLHLNASGNQIKALPSAIGAASSLQSLELQDNVRRRRMHPLQ